MSRTLFIIVFVGSACLVALPDASAQARPPAQTAKPAAAPDGWLASPLREDPSPSLVSLKGAGTANAVAEARFTHQELSGYCQENAHLYPSAGACLKQKQSEYGTKIFRATGETVRFLRR